MRRSWREEFLRKACLEASLFQRRGALLPTDLCNTGVPISFPSASPCPRPKALGTKPCFWALDNNHWRTHKNPSHLIFIAPCNRY